MMMTDHGADLTSHGINGIIDGGAMLLRMHSDVIVPILDILRQRVLPKAQ